MSATRASGANRTSARGGAPAPKSRVMGSFVLNDAVWYEAAWFFISTAPITPACNSRASAPRLADQASVRGESFAKNSTMRAEILSDADGLRAGSASIAANSFCMERADGAPRLSLRSMVSAYSSRIATYCFASSGSRASASSTRRTSRAFKVPAACHGNSISISLGSCSSIFLLIAIMASLALRRLPSAVRPISCARKTAASLRCFPGYRRFSHLFHGFLVVVDKIDDLPMFRRKCGQALAQRFTGILLLHRNFRIVGRILDRIGGLIVQFNVLPAAQRRQGLESRNCQKPGGNGGSAFELASLAPHIEKNLTDEVFRDLFIPHETAPKPQHPDITPSVHPLPSEPVPF